ncbi:MAG: RNA polymerase factor sigma-32 [Pseudomonadota bacterium]
MMQSSDDPNRRFVTKAMKAPMLEAEFEKQLATRWRDDEDEGALHELTTAYMRLVIAMASKFRNYGLPMADLVQEGNVGLMLAAAKFDPTREVRFSTYAMWWVRSAMQDYVLRNWSIVRTGTSAAHKKLFFNLRRLRAQIDDIDGASMTPQNVKTVADDLGVKERDVEFMASRLSASDSSLNAPVATDGDMERQDLLEDFGPSPEEAAIEVRDAETYKNWVSTALMALDEREQFIIKERRLSDEKATLGALGDRLGISKERVRQLEERAIGKLRTSLKTVRSEFV